MSEGFVGRVGLGVGREWKCIVCQGCRRGGCCCVILLAAEGGLERVF